MGDGEPCYGMTKLHESEEKGSCSSLQLKMIVKVQYRNQKKYIKIPEACFDIFITEGNEREVFHPCGQHLISAVEDETGTEVDDYAFPDLLTTSGICFVIKDELNDSGGTDTISVTSKSSSDNDFYSGTLKRFRKEEEALQGPQAKNLIKQVLLTKPGGSDVLKEYEEKGTISPDCFCSTGESLSD
ncbi:hypothetical protein KUCAC02_000628 [Chaenocephalus aceratus]|uniref:Uncharacterized protein n=1 Tax=Chaenocephalus aceratus TaxID=36190 RepID=A0ACB9W634_CHAAC|nr:hypothetical protein KUCAC02_000628 [Chaenocephalus aceratus]